MIEGRFTRNNNLSSHFIRLFTWSDWSHIETKISNVSGLTDGWAGAHPKEGFVIRPFNYNPACQFQNFKIDTTKEVELKIYQFIKLQLGKPYDWTALIGLGLHRDWHNPDKWFCSEEFAAQFDYAKDALIRCIVDRVTPGMIWENERLIFT